MGFATTALLSAAGATALGACANGMFNPRSCLFGPVISKASPRSMGAVLTFDDGPMPGSTESILDTLKRQQVSATFFVIGRYARSHPELLMRMHAEGHIIANHSMDHSRVGLFYGRRYWIDQIQRAADTIERAIGRRPALFRPPMGFKSQHLMAAARHCGCRVVTWSRRAFDGVATAPNSILARAAQARPRDIILLHDGRDPASRRDTFPTALALPRIIDAVRLRGLALEGLDRTVGSPYHGAEAAAIVSDESKANEGQA